MATGSEEVASLSRDGSVENLPLDDTSSSAESAFLCQICNERFQTPRVLHCLHVFCTPCLDKLVESGAEGTSVVCPTCKQVTKLTTGIADLLVDVIIINMMEMAEIRTQQVRCTSCKAEEKAVARCSNCSSFLCPSCVTAHNYMLCFEKHKVESFEELCNDESRGIHKPMFCNLHPTESLKYFCTSCEVPVCTECVVSFHKIPDHKLENIAESDRKHAEDLDEIMKDTKSKINTCEDASGKLESLLSDLQQQHDNARDLIKESFQSYKAMLEKCKDEMLDELETVHSSTELEIMDMYHNIEKAVEQIEDGCKFTERVLKNGNMVEVLLMKKNIRQQLLMLLNNIPRPDMNVKIEFVTDSDRFRRSIKEVFGHFKKSEEDQEKKSPDLPHSGSMHSSFEGENFTLPTSGGQHLSVSEAMLAPLVQEFIPSLSGLSALSSSPIPDLTSSIITSLSNMSVGSLGPVPPAPPSLHSLPYSVERSLSRNSYSPSMSDSGIIVDAAGASTSSSNQSLLSLQGLIKMGALGVNGQGQITVNGQVVPGLNLNSSSGGINPSPLPPAPGIQSRVHLPLPSVSDPTLAGLFNSVGLAPSNPLSPATPLNEISALFSSLPPHQASLGLGGIRTTSPITAAVAAANLLSAPPPALPLNGGMAVPGAPGGALRVRNSGKISSMDIRCKFGQLGPGKGQFNSPHGFCLGIDEDIVVADTNNHRIQVFEKNGEFKYQFGIPGREEGQLWYPRKVAVIRATGKYVICDRGSERSRMQLFTKNGQFIKKIAIRYIDIVAGLAITSQGHIVAVDSVSPTVFCISESGDLVKWFDCSDYMREPSDIAVSGKDYYVCDFKGHCVVVFNEDGQFLHRIGCENITNYPNGIDISDAGDVLIGDSHGNRFHVAVFQRDGHLIGEFECPYVKVSRCCGLKITSEGYVVTLAKNNQHVLVLNTLYIA